MTATHEIKLAGLTLEVTGYYDSGEEGNHFVQGSPAYFEAEEVKVDGVDLTQLFTDYIGLDEVENTVMEEHYS